MRDPNIVTWLQNLNALVGGLFLLAAFGLVAMRQVDACLRLFVALSVFLAASAFLLSALFQNWHLTVVGIVDLLTKAIMVPWLLRRSLRDEVYTRREITQVLNIPTSLLIALALTIVAYLLSTPLLAIGDGLTIGLNLPIGLAGLLIGGLTAAVRREAVPLFLAGFGAKVGFVPMHTWLPDAHRRCVPCSQALKPPPHFTVFCVCCHCWPVTTSRSGCRSSD